MRSMSSVLRFFATTHRAVAWFAGDPLSMQSPSSFSSWFLPLAFFAELAGATVMILLTLPCDATLLKVLPALGAYRLSEIAEL
jgi:hypothetical protein